VQVLSGSCRILKVAIKDIDQSIQHKRLQRCGATFLSSLGVGDIIVALLEVTMAIRFITGKW